MQLLPPESSARVVDQTFGEMVTFTANFRASRLGRIPACEASTAGQQVTQRRWSVPFMFEILRTTRGCYLGLKQAYARWNMPAAIT
jgi:hypothetical protein